MKIEKCRIMTANAYTAVGRLPRTCFESRDARSGPCDRMSCMIACQGAVLLYVRFGIIRRSLVGKWSAILIPASF
jgi:hypothetical protein